MEEKFKGKQKETCWKKERNILGDDNCDYNSEVLSSDVRKTFSVTNTKCERLVTRLISDQWKKKNDFPSYVERPEISRERERFASFDLPALVFTPFKKAVPVPAESGTC